MKTFVFMLANPIKIEGTASTYKVPSIEKSANTIEEAWSEVEMEIPEGFRMFCWYVKEA